MDDEQALLNEPEPEPRSDAAEAFARLEARVGGLEQRIEGRLSMLTRAVEQITMERQSFEIPDYSPTLAKLGGYLATLAREMKKVADAPAMALTPESMAERIDTAAEALRDRDRAILTESRDLHYQACADLKRAAGIVRTVAEQRWHMLYAGSGAALTVSLLWLIYPGWIAGTAPHGWHWPEAVARRTMGEPSLWDAGIRLMRTGNPEGWQTIVEAVGITQANREAIAACGKAAAKAKQPVRCMITIAVPQP